MSELEISEKKTSHAMAVESLRIMASNVPAGEKASAAHEEKIQKIKGDRDRLLKEINAAEREKGRSQEAEAPQVAKVG